MMSQAQSRQGPLSGVKVLDLSAYIAGPYACSLLADQGAQVIKIESPSGDNLRNYPSTLASESRAFLGVNRSKLGLVLDLKKPQDLERLYTLVRQADVLVHNFRPSVPKRLQIDYDTLQAINSRLIYCSLSGYGRTGPLKDKAGYDQVLQSMTGMSAMQAKPDGPPEILYGSVVDFYAASMLAGAVSSALYEREKSGLGQAVDISLMSAALAMQSTRLVWADSEPREVGRDMRSGGITGIHPTREGHIYISANTPHFWQALCQKTGLTHFADDPRFETVRLRAQNKDLIVPALRQALSQKSALEWEELFGEEVPCSAVRTVEDMFDFPQVLSQDFIQTFEHPAAGTLRALQKPYQFSRTPCSPAFAAPMLDQHGEKLRETLDRQREKPTSE